MESKKSKTTLFVIVPYKNVEKYVNSFADGFSSVLKSKNVNLLLVNDHSTDGSQIKIKKRMEQGRNINFLNSPFFGVSAARNFGLQYLYNKFGKIECNEIWVTFCDFDDMVVKSISSVLKLENKLKNFDYIFFGYSTNSKDLENTKAVMVKKMQFLNPYSIAIGGPFSLEKHKYNLNSPWAKLIKLSFLKKNKLYFNQELTFREDLLFNLKIFSHQPNIGMIEKTYYLYCINNNSTIHGYVNDALQQNELLLTQISKLKISENLINEYIYTSFIQSLFVYVFPKSGISTNFFITRKRFFELKTLNMYNNLFLIKHLKSIKNKKNKLLFLLSKQNMFVLLYVVMNLRKIIKAGKSNEKC